MLAVSGADGTLSNAQHLILRSVKAAAMSASDRVAIVTGASTGIGRGIARRLAADGVDVVVASRNREPKTGDRFQTDLSTPTDELLEAEYDVESRWIETDVTDPSAVEHLVETTVETFGQLDHLVNNAGMLIPGDTQPLAIEEWHTVIDVNIRGYFTTAKYAVPHLVDSAQGRIVNISSVNANVGGAGPAYTATKAAIVNMTRDLAVELAEAEVTANAVLPGVIKTPMQDINDDETIDRQREQTALPRIGTPEDVGNAVAFFCSAEAAWITGADLLVDGGYLAGGY
jgi:NAD(P)-dependent dehydrogenase (short-subunit alcohol dehydrogenase family)